MLVGLAGLLAGYDGSFEFKSGEAYPESVPYVAMRVMLATFGVGMVPLAWYTAVELGMSQWASHLTAMMVLLGTLIMFQRHGYHLILSQMSVGYVYPDSSSSIQCFCSSRSLLFSV
jgi:hypothetical protein